jgi:hypothetical protein
VPDGRSSYGRSTLSSGNAVCARAVTPHWTRPGRISPTYRAGGRRYRPPLLAKIVEQREARKREHSRWPGLGGLSTALGANSRQAARACAGDCQFFAERSARPFKRFEFGAKIFGARHPSIPLRAGSPHLAAFAGARQSDAPAVGFAFRRWRKGDANPRPPSRVSSV